MKDQLGFHQEKQGSPIYLLTSIPTRGAQARVMAQKGKNQFFLLSPKGLITLEFQGVRDKEGEFALQLPENIHEPPIELSRQDAKARLERIIPHLGHWGEYLELEDFPRNYDPRLIYLLPEGILLLGQKLQDILRNNAAALAPGNWFHPGKSGAEGWSWSLSMEILRFYTDEDPLESHKDEHNLWDRRVPDPTKHFQETSSQLSEMAAQGLGYHREPDFAEKTAYQNKYWKLWAEIPQVLEKPKEKGQSWRSALAGSKKGQGLRRFLRRNKTRFMVYGALSVVILFLSFGGFLGADSIPTVPNQDPLSTVQYYYSGFEKIEDQPPRRVWAGSSNSDLDELARMFILTQVQLSSFGRSSFLSPDIWFLLERAPLEQSWNVYGIRNLSIELAENGAAATVEYEKWASVENLEDDGSLSKSFRGTRVIDYIELSQEVEGKDGWYIISLARETDRIYEKDYQENELIPIDWTALGMDGPPGLP